MLNIEMNFTETGINPKTADDSRQAFLSGDGNEFLVFRLARATIDGLQPPRTGMIAGEHGGALLALRLIERQTLQLANGIPAVGRAERHRALDVADLAPGRKIHVLMCLTRPQPLVGIDPQYREGLPGCRFAAINPNGEAHRIVSKKIDAFDRFDLNSLDRLV